MKGYGITLKHAMPGDLVMDHVSDINHPAYLSDNISRNCVLFGIVRNFVYMDWKIETGKKEHDMIKNHDQLNIKWASVPGDGTNEAITPPGNHWVKVLVLTK